jgi:hypothetical protein
MIIQNSTNTYQCKHQVNLATLPLFSNEVKEKQYNAAQ